MLRLLLILLLAHICLASPAFGGVYWPAPNVLQDIPGGYSSLETGPGGTLHLAFYDYTPANHDLHYAVRSAAGEWTFEIVESGNGDNVGRFASLELDQAGVPHIAYLHSGLDHTLKYAVRQGPNDWDIQVVDANSGHGWYSSLALDSAGNPHIAYYTNQESDLLYAWHDPVSGWQFETIDSEGYVGKYCSLALNSSDLCRISYFDATNERLKFAWQQSGGEWLIEVVDDSGNAGIDTTVDLDDQEHPHVAYWDRGNNALKYAWHDGTDWHTEIVDTGADCGYEACIVWAGKPCISYEGTVGARYAEKVGGSWRTYQVDRTGYKCGYTALALEGAGHPRMTYMNTGNASLYYAEAIDCGLPDAPTPEPVSTIAELRAKPGQTWISISGQVVSASGIVSGYYIEDPDRCAGVCVVVPEYAVMPSEGDELAIVGVVETGVSPERVIHVCDWTSTGTPGPIQPVFSDIRDLKAAVPTTPLSSLGLLVRTSGRVISVGDDYIVLDDGSPAGGEQGLRVMLGDGWPSPEMDEFVAVTGVLSMQMVDDEPTPVLLPRRSEDITIIASKQANRQLWAPVGTADKGSFGLEGAAGPLVSLPVFQNDQPNPLTYG